MILYHINSHQCKTIKQKLIENELPFEEITNIPTILEKGITQVPTLEYDNNLMDFFQTLAWFKRCKDNGY